MKSIIQKDIEALFNWILPVILNLKLWIVVLTWFGATIMLNRALMCVEDPNTIDVWFGIATMFVFIVPSIYIVLKD